MIRIVVIDDPTTLPVIHTLLTSIEGVEIAGETSNRKEAVQTIERIQPDLLILGLSIPGMNGFKVLKNHDYLAPGSRVIVVSTRLDEKDIQEALDYGAFGYIQKINMKGDLPLAIQAVSNGKIFIGSGIPQEGLNLSPVRKNQDPIGRLSPREKAVIQRIVGGYSTREIAKILKTSVKTVEKQRRDAMRKLNVNSTSNLVRTALENGITGPITSAYIDDVY